MRTLSRLLFRGDDGSKAKGRSKKKKSLGVRRLDVRRVKAAFLCEEEGRRGRLWDKQAVISRTGEEDRERLKNLQDIRRSRPGFGTAFLLVFGALNVAVGILSLVRTPFELLMDIRLNMVPGLPPYNWWMTPPDEVLLKAYVFNITNSEAFMNGTDQRLRVQEVGPFVFLEKIVHTNVTINSNGTLSYTAHRTAIFRPELTQLSLNDTIITPNLAVLGMASKLHDASFFTKLGFNMLMRRTKSPALSEVTIYNYMWNWSDPIIDIGKKLFPFMVPAHNMGVLHNIYEKFNDPVTVHIGTARPRQFFTMTHYHGHDRFKFWPDRRCDSLRGATEGVTYPQSISRNDTLHYFRKTICRTMPVEYAHDTEKYSLNAYRFNLPLDLFHRHPDPKLDCFKGNGPKPLPSGASDVSPCYFDFPIAATMPHFLGAEESLARSIEGQKPVQADHQPFVIVEPLTGVPLESHARSQSNLVVRPLKGFGDLSVFSDQIIPMFWLEYHQVGLPWYISSLLYFTVVIIPASQTAVSVSMIALGSALILAAVTRLAVWLKHGRALYVYSSLDLIPSSTSNSDC